MTKTAGQEKYPTIHSATLHKNFPIKNGVLFIKMSKKKFSNEYMSFIF